VADAPACNDSKFAAIDNRDFALRVFDHGTVQRSFVAVKAGGTPRRIDPVGADKQRIDHELIKGVHGGRPMSENQSPRKYPPVTNTLISLRFDSSMAMFTVLVTTVML